MGTSKRSITGRGVFGGMRLGVAIAGILLAGVALAQGPGGEMGSKPGFGEHRPPFEQAFGSEGAKGRFWNNPKIVEALKLTDDQRKAMDSILMEHREKLIDLRASLQKAELGMEPLMGQDQPDESRILAQIDKVAQARAELEKANARFLLALRSKLTPDQWKQMQALRANRGRDGRGWGRDGQGKGGPGQGGQFRRQGPPPPPPGGPAGGAQSQLDQGPGPDDEASAGIR
ncbi:MAG: Spy/CpxP family protein refolding chaperone [Terracidiphilus sp.]